MHLFRGEKLCSKRAHCELLTFSQEEKADYVTTGA